MAMRQKLFRLIGRLTVGRKLALIYFLDLTAVIFVSGILIEEKFIAIDFATKEIVGNQYIAVVSDALLALAPLPAEASGRDTLAPARTALADTIGEAETRFGANLGTAQLSHDFGVALLTPQPPDQSHAYALRPRSADAFAVGRALLTRIGNQSNLILDPDLDTYYTMSLIVLRFPELLEVLSSTSRLTLQLSAMPEAMRANRQTQFLILEGRIDAIVRGIDSDYDEAFAASNPMLKANLQSSQQQLRQAVDRFRSASQILAGLAEGRADAKEFAAIEATAMAALHGAWSGAQADLDRLIRTRVDLAFSRMWMHLGTAALLLIVILNVVFFVARQIAIPIRKLAGVADDVRRTGNYTLRAQGDNEDEIGRLVTGFNDMLQQLDHQRIAQQELVAQASAAEAQRELVEAIPIPLMVTAIPHHDVLHANHAARTWLSGQAEDPWQAGMDSAARARFFQRLSDLGAVDAFEVCWTGGVKPTWALMSARRVDYQGMPAVLTTFTPINRMKQMELRLELWAKVFEASSESIALMDPAGRIVTVNQAFCRSTAYEIGELVGRHPKFLVSERTDNNLYETSRATSMMKGSWQGEMWIKRKNLSSYPAWVAINAVRDHQGNLTHFIAISLDISERKESEQRIHYLAHHDVLTGLPNRFLCEERLQLSMQQARRSGGKVAVLFVDLDRFKNINDSLGHHVGDGLLRSVAARLSQAVREGDTVSRLGGDEFVVVLNNVHNVEEIGKIVENRLIASIQQAHDVDGVDLYASCSVGVAVFPDDGDDIASLMRHADSAMYQAKKLGRNNAQFFTPELNERVVKHLHLETDLRHAVERNELVLYYQPRVNARTGLIAGVECLVRWQHPTEHLIPPGRFIPVAEESGLIVTIGAWIIRQACRQHVLWRDAGMGEIPVSINLSAVQLKDGALLRMLTAVLEDHPVGAGQIELELTESILMDNAAGTIGILEKVKALGFQLSIDDFGTGYSSLNYLYRFPIDKLKIDRSFVQNIHSAPHNLAVTKAIIGLGHTLGLEVVAEGVERQSDVKLLQDAGCDELQGFYFGRPMPADAFEDWLRRHRISGSLCAAGQS
jgi:diguanylate cyclase (GGDEF)-like protein/PAS domain S-box-containing protein